MQLGGCRRNGCPKFQGWCLMICPPRSIRPPGSSSSQTSSAEEEVHLPLGVPSVGRTREFHCDGSACDSNRGFAAAVCEIVSVAEHKGRNRGPHAAELVSVLLALDEVLSCVGKGPQVKRYLVRNDNEMLTNGTANDTKEAKWFQPLIDLVT